MFGQDGQGAALRRRTAQRLSRQIDALIDRLEAAEDLAEVAAVEKHARATAGLARAAAAVADLFDDDPEPEKETDMDELGPVPTDPAEIERLRDDLRLRLEQIDRALEAKRALYAGDRARRDAGDEPGGGP
jgi:hypothetical protein